jgi:hypothetical protein
MVENVKMKFLITETTTEASHLSVHFSYVFILKLFYDEPYTYDKPKLA